MASHSRVLHFLENDLSAKTEEELSTRVIFEARGVNQGDLLTTLKVYFPCRGHHWTVKFVGNNRFLAHAPAKWKEQALGKRYILLGEVFIRVFRADSAFLQGLDLMQVWVKITDLSVGLRNRKVIAYLVHEFATLLECDMVSHYRSNIPWCRVLLEVADYEIILSYQWIEYIKRSNVKKIFKKIIVHQILPRTSPFGLGKRSTYWRPVEPGPKRFALGKSGDLGGSSTGGLGVGTGGSGIGRGFSGIGGSGGISGTGGSSGGSGLRVLVMNSDTSGSGLTTGKGVQEFWV
jgi:uncharacterized membrane protein YgcG